MRLCRPLSGLGNLSIVDGALNPMPLCDLDQPRLKEDMSENRGVVSFIPD